MTKHLSTRLTEDELKLAKQMYFDYEPVVKIAKRLGRKPNTIYHHIRNKNWTEQREINRIEFLHDVSTGQSHKLVNITVSLITVIERALDDLARKDSPPTIKEAKIAHDMLDTMDKWRRLDEGKPTEHIATEKPVKVIELQRRMKELSPYYDEEEASNEEEIIQIPEEDS